MNCNECRNLMDSYISGELSGNPLDDFVRHVRGCSDCIEELKINYSLLTALDQLDRGDELSEDYDSELEGKLTRYVERKKRIRILQIATDVLLFAAALFISILFFAFITDMDDGLDDVKFIAEGSEENLYIGYDGVPDSMNPVRQMIYYYNDEVIEYIHLKSLGEGK